jgi:hypothetical protein
VVRVPTEDEIPSLLEVMSPEHRAETLALLASWKKPIWKPQKGPQETAFDSTADVLGYGGSAGGGKGLSLETPLPTPAGWTTMGEVQVGDILFDEQGKPCQVTAVSEVQHRPCYRLEFDDGTELVADDVHRWLTFDANELGAMTRRDPEWRAARRERRQSRVLGRRSALFTQAVIDRNKRLPPPVKPMPAGTVRSTSEI